MNNLQSLSLYLPELILTVTVLSAIVFDLFLPKEKSPKVGWLVFGGLILSGMAIWVQKSPTTTLFMDAIVLDPFAQFFKLLIILATLFVIIASQVNSELDGYSQGEYYSLLGILVFGLFLMVSSVDLISVYLSLEVVSIMSFILSGYLKNDKRSNESALKYVIYGAFSSGVMLYGMSLIYGIAGSTNFFEIQNQLVGGGGEYHLIFVIAVVMILVGFGYKISMVPFHFWTPDVYEGAPTTITAFLSVAPKAGGLALFIRFFHQVMGDGVALEGNGFLTTTELPWPQMVAVLAVATMTLGNLVALQQKSIKRMLAYSSIAHAGYMLMALPVLSADGIQSIMIYLVMYLFMNLGAFFVVLYVKNKTGNETFEDYSGLGWKMPILGIVMTVFMVSLTGLPPTAGFIGKFYIFASVIKGGSQFYWLAFFGAFNSVISLYYYFRVVKVMYLEGAKSDIIESPNQPILGLLLATSVPSLFLGIYWQPVIKWVENSFHFFTQIL
ncbi:MAG: NADH-quinone oxidoreductase subunit N [Candidatus Marinimicrobia bacterium]|nr:NADH-quinone oxidoreductase subunit N [Candidatus Neomarinimicrobiota bacterium]